LKKDKSEKGNNERLALSGHGSEETDTELLLSNKNLLIRDVMFSHAFTENCLIRNNSFNCCLLLSNLEIAHQDLKERKRQL
jgi:hypothetical protein